MSVNSLYINSFDNSLDISLDNFNLFILNNLKKLETIESNNQLFSTEINNIIEINLKSLNIFTKIDEFNKKKIIDIFYTYLYLYLFLYLNLYKDEKDLIKIVNDIININKLTKSVYFKQLNYYCNFCLDLFKIMENIKKTSLLNSNTNIDSNFETEYKAGLDLLSDFTDEIFDTLLNNKDLLNHTLIKIIIYKLIYIKIDKLDIYKIIEKIELDAAESKIIKIVENKFFNIDYSSIENLFSVDEIKKKYPDDMYNLLIDYVNLYINKLTIDDKINILFKKGILIPIVDDFLRYNKTSDINETEDSTKIEKSVRTNKKDDTKIKYIITKMNNIKDIYSKKHTDEEINKYFYEPLIHRQAVLINDLEEINILYKLELHSHIGDDVYNLYKELLNIRLYPYLDFNSSKHTNFFNFSPSDNYTAVRYSNLKYLNSKQNLEFRIINNLMNVSIVGVLLPKYNFIFSNGNLLKLNFIELHHLKNINKINKNSYYSTICELKHIFLKDSSTQKLYYWLFDKQTDILHLSSYDQISKLSNQEYFQILLSYIYDNVVEISYKLILNNLKLIHNLNYSTFISILKNIQKKLVIIPLDSDQHNKLYKYYYYNNYTSKIDKYDTNENYILGLNQKFIKLPKYESKRKIELKKEITDNLNIICQHEITFNNIIKLATDVNKFNDLMFSFTNKYVIETEEQNLICKSCNQIIDINKYVTEIYPGSSGILISLGLTTPLNEILEYTKYSKSIRYIEKIIEQIVNISNIYFYKGTTKEIKLRREEIVKDIIDLLNNNYIILFSKNIDIRKKRLEYVTRKYGCFLSNYYFFKLEDTIFTQQKNIDKMNLYKKNNIYVYIIIILILKINNFEIINLEPDKFFNYILFDKLKLKLFDNLYIRISTNGDLDKIINYTLLIYIIYYLSGLILKLNLWYSESEQFKKNQLNINIHKIIIHTVVDCLNSILENQNKSYFYEFFSFKFYNILYKYFKDDVSKTILKKLESKSKKKILIVDNKLTTKINKIEPINLIKRDYSVDLLKSIFGVYIFPKLNIFKKNIYYYQVTVPNLNNILNNNYNEKINEYKLNIIKLYDENGKKRKINLINKELDKFDENKINKIFKNILNNSKKIINKFKKIEFSNQEIENKLSKLYQIDYSKQFDKFFDSIFNTIKTDVDKYSILENKFYIKNDYIGNKIDEILLKSDSIKYINFDSFFKQNVYIYIDYNTNITMYYSAINLYYLGYKDTFKNYIKIYNSNSYLKINYSIYNLVKYLGFTSIYYKIDNIKNINEIIQNILDIRIQNIKNFINYLLEIIYQIIFKTKHNVSHLSKQYQSLIESIQIKGENKIFMDKWQIISNNIKNEKINIDINKIETFELNKETYISINEILKFCTNDNYLINYIIDQYELLLSINKSKNIQNNLIFLFIKMIIEQSNRNFIFTNSLYNINVRNFYNYMLYKINIDIDIKDIEISNLNEDELETYNEEVENFNELNDALDIEQFSEEDDLEDEILMKEQDH